MTTILTNSRKRLLSLLSHVLELGTGEYPKATKRRLVIVNLMAYLSIVASLNYAIVYASFDPVKYRAIVFVNIAIVFVLMVVPFLHRFNDYVAGTYIAVTEGFLIFWLVGQLGRDAGIQINYFVGAAVPFLAFDFSRMVIIIVMVISTFVLHILAWFWYPPAQAVLQAEPSLLANIYVTSVITAFGIIVAIVYYALRVAQRAEAETMALMRNILPASVADRLLEAPNDPIADEFANASVLFADLCGFTPMATKLGPGRTVAVLNDTYTAFDKMTDRPGLEKIKTIGDAYMVAGGVPARHPGHERQLAGLALDMLTRIGEISQSHGVALDLRIGIASGPVMAGVIGKNKFSYDVWGNTVNMAARLESHGLPGKIQVTGSLKQILEHDFTFEKRGTVDIKGVGATETWFLTGVKP